MSTTWHKDTRLLVEELARTGEPFDVYDLRRAGAQPPPGPYYWGSLFAAAYRVGIVFPLSGYRQPEEKHLKPVRRWQGTPALFDASQWKGTA